MNLNVTWVFNILVQMGDTGIAVTVALGLFAATAATLTAMWLAMGHDGPTRPTPPPAEPPPPRRRLPTTRPYIPGSM